MKNCLVSIIIPVYNAKSYLRDCVESVLSQSYTNIEIFLVDDGSTDGSGKICDEYGIKDRRVNVIHKKNGGQAEARNIALDLVRGEYIAFADSDDILKQDYIEHMLTLLLKENADIIQCEYEKFWDNKKLNKHSRASNNNKYSLYATQEALKEFSYQRKFSPSPWCKLVKREVWGDIRFPVGLGYEDYAIMYRVLGQADKLIYSPYCTYFYRIHCDSAQHSEFSNKKKDRLFIADALLNFIKDNYPEIEQAARFRYCLAQFQYLMELPFDKKYSNEKKEAIMNIKKYRLSVFKDSDAPNKMKVMIFASYFGADALMILGRLYMKITNR